MKFAINKLKLLLLKTENYFDITADEIIESKPDPNKWSRKEIIGHLIDSAIHNTIRFTESNYLPQPYNYRPYNQDELVKINNYQMAPFEELLQLWLYLNRQIIRIMESRTNQDLNAEIKLNDQSIVTLRYLMTDYPDHIEHHLNQIIQ